MRYLTVDEVLEVHRQVMVQSSGAEGLVQRPALESALAQSQMTFAGQDLYPTLVDKAAALGHAIIQNHPFLDGNKRTGHAAMEVFLVLNGHEIRATVDEQERVVLQVAAGKLGRQGLAAWLPTHVMARK